MYPCAQVPKVGQKLTGRQRALSSLSLDNLVLVLAFFVPPSPPPSSSSSGPSANSGPVTHHPQSHATLPHHLHGLGLDYCSNVD